MPHNPMHIEPPGSPGLLTRQNFGPDIERFEREQIDLNRRRQEENRRRAMAGEQGHASIRATPSRASSIWGYLQHKLPRQAGEAVRGAFYGTGAGALRIGQALIPGEQPRMAAMEQYGLDQIPEEGIGAATGLLGSFAPEFTWAGDAADLGRAYGHLTNREDGRWAPEWGGAALSSIAAIPFVGTPVAGLLKARRGARVATEAAGAAQEAQRVARDVLDPVDELGMRASTRVGPSGTPDPRTGLTPEQAATRTSYIENLPAVGSAPGISGRTMRTRPDGTYYGGPMHGATRVDSPAKLEKMRRDYIAQAIEGIEGRDWYLESSQFIDRTAPRGRGTRELNANLLAIGSQGRTPSVSLGSTSEVLSQRAVGDPIRGGPYPEKLQSKYDATLAGTAPRPGEFWLGDKLDPYRQNIQVTRYPQFANRAVHDIWEGRAFGYRHAPTDADPRGLKWSSGFDDAQHKFMDDELEVIIKYMNDNKVGGFDDWNPLNTQAAAWRGAQIRDPSVKSIGPPGGYSVLSPRYHAYATTEQVPAVIDMVQNPLATPHIRMEDRLAAERAAYSRGKTAQQIGPGGRDLLYEKAGVMQDRTLSSTGSFSPYPGLLEFNPLEVHRPLVYARDGKLIEQSERLLNTVEGGRAYADVQNAGSWHYLIPQSQTANALWQRTSVHIPLDRAATEAELKAIHDIADKNGWFVSDTGAGVNLIEDPTQTPGWAARLTAKSSLTDAEKARLEKWNINGWELQSRLTKGDLGIEIGQIFPDAELTRVKAQSGYIGFDLTQPGSGSATQTFLDLMDAEPEVARAIEARLAERMKINARADEAFAIQSGRPQNPDVIRARDIFIKAVEAGQSGYEALRKALADPNIALPSVAILGALGLQSQLGDQPPGRPSGLLGSSPM